MKSLSLTYPKGGAFTVSAETDEELVGLMGIALKLLWGENSVMTLDDADEWLGWKSPRN